MATKAEWLAAKAELDAVEAEHDALVKAAVAPIEDRYNAAHERFDLIDEDCPERFGDCVGCCAPIWEGDRYAYDSENAIYTCEECAPSYEDMLDSPGLFYDADGEYLTPEKARAAVDAHLAAGGSLTDKMVSA